MSHRPRFFILSGASGSSNQGLVNPVAPHLPDCLCHHTHHHHYNHEWEHRVHDGVNIDAVGLGG
jgi:hypothetical protein